MAVKKKIEDIKVEAEPVMYLGPTIPQAGLKTNQLYCGGIPEKFNQAPLKRLFAKPLEIASLKASIQKAGTVVDLAYKVVLREWSGK